jgi:tripartite-type tricarboxylate transporter receptor subunit TctC
MKTNRRALAPLAGALMLTRPAMAEEFPNRALRFVVPFAPGGSLDILGRLYARYLGERLGWQVVVDNRSGAGGNLGTDMVAKSRPDGYTVLVHSDPLTVVPALFPTLPFDPLRDLQGLALVARISQVLIVPSNSPLRDFAAFLEAAKVTPQGAILGHTGAGSAGQLIAALLGQAGIPTQPVPYRGGGPLAQDVMAGNLSAGITTLPSTMSFLRDGSVKALAVSSSERSIFLPDVPAMREVLPDLTLDSWQGLFLPAGTPPAIRQKLNDGINATTAMPAVREWLLGQAFEPVTGPSADLDALMAREVPRWRAVVQATGLINN